MQTTSVSGHEDIRILLRGLRTLLYLDVLENFEGGEADFFLGAPSSYACLWYVP